MASSRSRMPALPAGFRFHPTDEELIVHYLMNQAAAAACPVPIIAEVNIYQCNPWDLPAKAVFGEKEWYFFSPRDRKYPNGARPNRAAGSGYWKATGTDKAIVSTPTSQNIGVKKALVFYRGKPPRGTKTDWIMHEYRLTPTPTTTPPSTHLKRRRAGAGSSSSMRLDDWVLCRIYKKSNDFQLAGAGDVDDDPEQDEGSTVEDHHSLNVIGNTDTSPKREAPAGDDDDDEQQQLGAAMTITKSCSLTDLLSSIDYSTLSQLLLDVDVDAPPPPQSPLMHATPPCQTPNHNNIIDNNVNVNEHISVAQVDHHSGSSDYSTNTNCHGSKRRRLSLDDGSRNNSARTQMLPADSRMIGFGSYCNQQIADHESGFQFQYSGLPSYPFLNQQLLLNQSIENRDVNYRIYTATTELNDELMIRPKKRSKLINGQGLIDYSIWNC